MGKNNRARRAAKAKRTARERGQAAHDQRVRQEADGQPRSDERTSRSGPRPRDESRYTNQEMAQRCWTAVVRATIDGAGLGRALDDLQALDSADPHLVSRSGEDCLVRWVAECWAGGWQPVELARQGRRGTSTATAARLVALAIANDNANRRAATLDARWMRQVDGLALPAADGRAGWLDRWARHEGLDRPGALRAAADAIGALGSLPRIDVLIPPPGATSQAAPHGRPPDRGPVVDADPMLERIRNLLAKAESTPFEAEAAAFTAKAQALMTRHAIDAAVLGAGSRGIGETPTMIRLPIDAPYADAKALLLHVVAESGRCRAVGYNKLDLVVVMGFAADLTAVEMLFTSLLVQAQSALSETSRHARPGTRVRSQSYRSAFLVAFAHRVGERLREVNEHVFAQAAADQGPTVALVLQDRSAAVDEAMAARFGELTKTGVRGGYDGAGYASGQLAADRARLAAGDLTDTDPWSNEPGESVPIPMLR